MNDYQQLQRRLGSGWNTWNIRSILSHVWLGKTPAEDERVGSETRGGFAVNLGFWFHRTGTYVESLFPGIDGVRVGAHSLDGSYSDLTVRMGAEIRVESGHDGDDLVLLITCVSDDSSRCDLVIEGGLLWNRPGSVQRLSNTLVGHVGDDTISVYTTGEVTENTAIPLTTPYLVVSTEEPVGISTGRKRTMSEIHAAIITRRAEQQRRRANHSRHADTYEAVTSCVGWNTIYDPATDSVFSPATRVQRGSYKGGVLLSGSDQLFAALTVAADTRELAYANLLAPFEQFVWQTDIVPSSASTAPAVRSKRLGFLPATTTTANAYTPDISKAPLASFIAMALFQRNHETWPLSHLFDKLLAWNRWWSEHRDVGGLVSWRSKVDQFDPSNALHLRSCDIHGEVLLAGDLNIRLANDEHESQYNVADVGLNALYILDTDNLANMAKVLGRYEEKELRERASQYRREFVRLWNDDDGMYYNLNTLTNEHEKAPTIENFYPLIAQIPTLEQVERIVNTHLCDSTEFWSMFGATSQSMNRANTTPGNRGAVEVSGTQNLLVYLSLINYDFSSVQKELATRCEALLSSEWRTSKKVGDEQNPATGKMSGAPETAFTNRGALLGLIALMEAG